MTGQVHLETDGPVATVVFDHSERRNAMTVDMWDALPGICHAVENIRGIRVVVLRGAGDEAFVSGADISEFGEHREGAKAARYDSLTAAATDALARLSMPVVASIHGFCIGGGLAIALAADIRYASEDAVFGLPPARLGIGYRAAGVADLVDLVGPAVAKEMLFTADLIDAMTALRWGLVNRVTTSADLDAFVAQKVATMATRAPLSQRAAKAAVANHLKDPTERRDDEVASLIARCLDSDDYREGVEAFLEKRRPRFVGR